jgi:hypothetical protein
VPVQTNPKTRESRLFKSMHQHVLKSAGAIIRAYIMYKPYVIFTFLAAVFGVAGLVPYVRWAILQIADSTPGGHLQSLLIGAVLLIMAFMSVIIGIISDLIRTNRMLIEDTLEHTKKMRFGKGCELVAPSAAAASIDAEAALLRPERMGVRASS